MSEPNKQGARDERRHDDLPGDGRDSADASNVHQLLSNFDFGDLLASVDAFDSGDAEGGDEVDLVPDEETDAIAYGPDQELAVAALSGVPDIAAPKRRKKDEGLRTFTEEDFEEGVERICFKMVSANVECLFDRKRKPEDYIKAAHWVFGRTLGDFTFERCCIALGTRKDVLHLRIHYEFWRRWYVFPIEFPFLIDPVPDSVEGEIYMLAGDEGYALARAAWMHPGIRSIQLLEVSAAATEAKGKKRPSEDRMREALKLLSEKYLMSQYNDSWYLTGRNPVLRAMDLSSAPNRVSRTHLSWSRMF